MLSKLSSLRAVLTLMTRWLMWAVGTSALAFTNEVPFQIAENTDWIVVIGGKADRVRWTVIPVDAGFATVEAEVLVAHPAAILNIFQHALHIPPVLCDEKLATNRDWGTRLGHNQGQFDTIEGFFHCISNGYGKKVGLYVCPPLNDCIGHKLEVGFLAGTPTLRVEPRRKDDIKYWVRIANFLGHELATPSLNDQRAPLVRLNEARSTIADVGRRMKDILNESALFPEVEITHTGESNLLRLRFAKPAGLGKELSTLLRPLGEK